MGVTVLGGQISAAGLAASLNEPVTCREADGGTDSGRCIASSGTMPNSDTLGSHKRTRDESAGVGGKGDITARRAQLLARIRAKEVEARRVAASTNG